MQYAGVIYGSSSIAGTVQILMISLHVQCSGVIHGSSSISVTMHISIISLDFNKTSMANQWNYMEINEHRLNNNEHQWKQWQLNEQNKWKVIKSMNIKEIQWRAMEIYENNGKSMKLAECKRNSMNINRNRYTKHRMQANQWNQRNPSRIKDTQWKLMEPIISENQRKSTKLNEHQWNHKIKTNKNDGSVLMGWWCYR